MEPRHERLSSGQHLAPGDRVTLMLSTANRDPARFAEPARFDIDRDAAGHLAFGRGRHACPGAPAIRMAVAVATEALLSATRTVEPLGEAEVDLKLTEYRKPEPGPIEEFMFFDHPSTRFRVYDAMRWREAMQADGPDKPWAAAKK